MNAFFRIANEGGPFFTYVILLLMVVIVALFIRNLIVDGNDGEKTIALLKSIAWFAVAWGFLGSNIGLITVFDRVQAAGDIAPSILAGGLKMTLVSPLFGIATFIIARACIIALILMKKN